MRSPQRSPDARADGSMDAPDLSRRPTKQAGIDDRSGSLEKVSWHRHTARDQPLLHVDRARCNAIARCRSLKDCARERWYGWPCTKCRGFFESTSLSRPSSFGQIRSARVVPCNRRMYGASDSSVQGDSPGRGRQLWPIAKRPIRRAVSTQQNSSRPGSLPYQHR